MDCFLQSISLYLEDLVHGKHHVRAAMEILSDNFYRRMPMQFCAAIYCLCGRVMQGRKEYYMLLTSQMIESDQYFREIFDREVLMTYEFRAMRGFQMAYTRDIAKGAARFIRRKILSWEQLALIFVRKYELPLRKAFLQTLFNTLFEEFGMETLILKLKKRELQTSFRYIFHYDDEEAFKNTCQLFNEIGLGEFLAASKQFLTMEYLVASGDEPAEENSISVGDRNNDRNNNADINDSDERCDRNCGTKGSSASVGDNVSCEGDNVEDDDDVIDDSISHLEFRSDISVAGSSEYDMSTDDASSFQLF